MLAEWGIHELSTSQIKQSSYVMLILGILKLHTLSERVTAHIQRQDFRRNEAKHPW